MLKFSSPRNRWKTKLIFSFQSANLFSSESIGRRRVTVSLLTVKDPITLNSLVDGNAEIPSTFSNTCFSSTEREFRIWSKLEVTAMADSFRETNATIYRQRGHPLFFLNMRYDTSYLERQKSISLTGELRSLVKLTQFHLYCHPFW